MKKGHVNTVKFEYCEEVDSSVMELEADMYDSTKAVCRAQGK